ncbi:MAG TPA: HD domain-containing protein [Candidatus Moranbacteria bacterium]|nr:HD domain-containing protein [Candidatus Moranbacteria bacterium]
MAEEKEKLILEIISNTRGYYPGDLVHYFKILFDNQSQSSFNPYHNFQHALYVCCTTYKGCLYEHIYGEEMIKLLIAALLHDYGHSGRVVDDKIQVEQTIRLSRKKILKEHEHLLEDIIFLIGSTCFPHKENLKSHHLTKLVNILRDADLSSIVDDNWLQHVVFGLSKEMNLAPIELLKKQIEFNSTIVYKSKYGKEVLAKKITNKLSLIKRLTSLIS